MTLRAKVEEMLFGLCGDVLQLQRELAYPMPTAKRDARTVAGRILALVDAEPSEPEVEWVDWPTCEGWWAMEAWPGYEVVPVRACQDSSGRVTVLDAIGYDSIRPCPDMRFCRHAMPPPPKSPPA